MKRAMLLMALSGCGYPFAEPDCTSPCGVRLYGSQDCAGFSYAEARMLAAFGPYRPDMCQHIRHWNVTTGFTDLHTNPWHAPGVEPVPREGQTWVDLHGVQLQDVSDWRRSSYAHEMAHVADAPAIDETHVTWTWQEGAIRQANQ